MKRLSALRYIAWIPLLAAFYLMFAIWGLPHIAFNYTYKDDGRGYEPFAPSRWYLSCTYVGWHGEFKFYPNNGTCPWFKFYKQDSVGAL